MSNIDIKFYWRVTRLEVVPSVGKLHNCVKRVCYEIAGECQETGELSMLAGETTLLDPNPKFFIPYFELTEDIVLKWVKSSIGTQTIADHENEITTYLQNIVRPQLMEMSLPWDTEEANKVVDFNKK
jgi:hypothetical protein